MMNYGNFTDTGLQMMHDAVHKAIEADKIAIGQGKEPPCRTSETLDWREHAKGLEDEMVVRGVGFVPVVFI